MLSRVPLLQPYGLDIACQAPLSMGCSRPNIGVGCHFLLQITIPVHIDHSQESMRFTDNTTGNPLYQKVTSYTIDAIIPIFVLGEDDRKNLNPGMFLSSKIWGFPAVASTHPELSLLLFNFSFKQRYNHDCFKKKELGR